jgi:hypothetical protein
MCRTSRDYARSPTGERRCRCVRSSVLRSSRRSMIRRCVRSSSPARRERRRGQPTPALPGSRHARQDGPGRPRNLAAVNSSPHLVPALQRAPAVPSRGFRDRRAGSNANRHTVRQAVAMSRLTGTDSQWRRCAVADRIHFLRASPTASHCNALHHPVLTCARRTVLRFVGIRRIELRRYRTWPLLLP